MFRNISIIGDGAMGTVLAMLLCEKQIPVRMWGYDAEQLKEIERATRRQHPSSLGVFGNAARISCSSSLPTCR